jgi:hypothetical protein
VVRSWVTNELRSARLTPEKLGAAVTGWVWATFARLRPGGGPVGEGAGLFPGDVPGGRRLAGNFLASSGLERPTVMSDPGSSVTLVHRAQLACVQAFVFGCKRRRVQSEERVLYASDGSSWSP